MSVCGIVMGKSLNKMMSSWKLWSRRGVPDQNLSELSGGCFIFLRHGVFVLCACLN